MLGLRAGTVLSYCQILLCCQAAEFPAPARRLTRNVRSPVGPPTGLRAAGQGQDLSAEYASADERVESPRADPGCL